MRQFAKKWVFLLLLCATTSALGQFGRGGGGFGSGGGGATSVASLITAPCATSTAVLFNAATPCSANLTYVSGTGLTSDGYITTGTYRAGATGGTMAFSTTAGAGPTIAAGTATTDVAALSVTRTNNNAAVATGVTIAFTDTTSAAGFLPFQVLGGAAAATNLFKVDKAGVVSAGSNIIVGTNAASAIEAGGGQFQISSVASNIGMGSGWVVSFGSVGSGLSAQDTGMSRIAAGVTGFGTGAAGAVDGTVAATNYRVAAKPVILGTAPTLASGGCTSPTAVTANGTARFSVGVGTSCSGSQPLVFTLPAATTGWNCYAQNSSNAATSVAAQSSAISTTSVTITSYSRTTGLAQAWTDSDVVVVSCLGG